MVKIKRKKIGNNYLSLDVHNKHERRYYRKKHHIDAILANAFVVKGNKVLDLGANIGFCTLHYLRNGASLVHAYEPENVMFNRLKEIEDKCLMVFDTAISDTKSEKVLYLSSKHQQGHSLQLDQVELFEDIFSKDVATQAVKTSTLDKIYNSQEFFDFIKIDVEGHELSALKGGRDLFGRNPSCILQIEIYPMYFDEVSLELRKSFNHIYLVFEAKIGGTFYLSENVWEEPEHGYKNTPPNFICSNNKIAAFTKDQSLKSHGMTMNILGRILRLPEIFMLHRKK